MLSRKVGPALAAGCTIVIKPSEYTPFFGLLYGVLAERAGVPAGVVNVTGDGAAIGGELTASRLVRKVTFTGSTRVGKLLYAQSADTMKKLSIELGVNAPTIVFDDADIELAVDNAIAAKFRNSRQTCVCTNRFYVQDGIYDEFGRRLTERVRQMKVGAGFEEGVVQGPLINQAAVGPVAALFRFDTEQEAIDAANATEFELAAYVFTRDLARSCRVARAIESGMIGINAGVITTAEAPFGGVKHSGIGREGSAHGVEDDLDLKYVNIGGL